MQALVTGFEPFGGDAINPAGEALPLLPRDIDGLAIATRLLPCVFGQAIAALEDAATEIRPDIVLCVGLAGGRAELSLERIAINIDDARIPDNAGQQPIDRPIAAGGPAAYFATLPIKACVAEMRKAGLPAAVSNTAGTFVCNHIFYALMDIAQSHPIPMRGGFLHIPYVPEQASRLGGAPSMALDDIVRGIEIVVEV